MAGSNFNAEAQSAILDQKHDQRGGGAAEDIVDGEAVGAKHLGNPLRCTVRQKTAVVADDHRCVVFALGDHHVADALRGVDTAVLLKNPVIPDVDLWVGAIERIYNSGVRRLGAIHRGFGTQQTTPYRNTPHWSVPIELHRRLPELTILSDPSHIGGRRELIAQLSQQALDIGFSGLMIECHPEPECALSDAAQQITPAELREIIASLQWRRTPVGRDALSEYRLHIDTIDSRIIELLSERMEVARAIGEYKHAHNMAVVQHDRYNELLIAAEARAEAIGLSPKFINQIFSAIHEESVRQQLDKQR